METQIDKFGRVLIPKAVRDHLGLKTGSVLYIEEQNQGVILKVAENTSLFKVKGGIVVYTGQATDDLESVLEEERDKRLDKLQGS
jgi:AbrB family looped-hinge helix DNA binding protein